MFVTIYSYIMTDREEKLLLAARRNPSGITFDDFAVLLSRCGWQFDRQKGSHQVWYSPEGIRISIQRRNDGKAKGYQVREFLKIIDEEKKGETRF